MIRSSLSRIKNGVKRRTKRVLDRVGLTDPEPAGVQVVHTAAATKPARSTPEPVEAAPEPVEAAPEPVEAAPEPVEAAPEPVEAAPEPVEAADDVVGQPLVEPALLTREQVWDLFEDMVRPALQADGGDIDLVKVENNDVFVRLVGACSGCPSSTVTMRMGIERLLQEEFPHFNTLFQVDDFGEIIPSEAF